MSVRPFLTYCRHAHEELRAMRQQINNLTTHEELQRAELYRDLLLKREQKIVSDLAKLEEMINNIEDPRSRTVMRYYYTMGWNDSQIGEEMDITDEWVRKKRYAAVRALDQIAENELA